MSLYTRSKFSNDHHLYHDKMPLLNHRADLRISIIIIIMVSTADSFVVYSRFIADRYQCSGVPLTTIYYLLVLGQFYTAHAATMPSLVLKWVGLLRMIGGGGGLQPPEPH